MSTLNLPQLGKIVFALGIVHMGFVLSAAAQVDSLAALNPATTAVNEPRAVGALNVSLAAFDPGIPGNAATHRAQGIFPKIRRVEARFLPYVMRDTLTRTGEWGAVRVVRDGSVAAELLITGVIVRSDGEVLELQLRAVDALGRNWIEKNYTAVANVSNTRSEPGSEFEPFQSLFDEFAEDLRHARAQFDQRSLASIIEVALLSYAGGLLPEAFGDYLGKDESGHINIQRLPARGDPMLIRIQRIRQFEYLFTDTLDEQYETLYSDIAPTYNLWRRYQRQLARYKLAEEQRRQNSGSSAPRGSYAALRESYENYKWIKMEEQNLDNWAAGFNNEIAPTVIDMEGRVVRLGGSLEERYSQWRTLLLSIFSLETGAGNSQRSD